jgi:hypothetical protein
MNARELEHASDYLDRKRARVHEGTLLALVCALLAAVIAAFAPDVALALLAGSAVAAAFAIANKLGRRDTIARLALEPSAYVLPDIRHYGVRLTLPAERARLAAWLDEVVREASIPGNWYLADRVACYEGQIKSLAHQLAAPGVPIPPATAVACHRLLTHASESPLYNPNVPADELPAWIDRIKRGIVD